MKIVHLNTHSYGGAAVVARRLHCAALACGIESQFITQYGIPGDSTPHYAALHSARLRYFLRGASADRRLHRVGRLAQQWTQHPNLAHRPAGFEIFSPLNDHPRYSDCTHGFDPDIIHLHWVSGFVDHAEFFQRNRDRKFVWTLHDMNPFTGGCHHSDGCLKFTQDCRSCPQLAGTIDADYAQSVLAAKRTWLSYLADDQLTIVSPSKWLLDLSRQSSVSGRFRHEHIANPALTAVGPAEPIASARAGLRLPSEKKLVLFVADNLRNPRKGFDLLFEAVRLLPRPESVQLVGIGQRADAPHGLAVTWAGRITDEAMLARYYRSADLVVSPSLAENSPLVVVEALQQGTPVVAFDVGGVGELVSNGSGVLAGTCSATSLAEAMQHALYERSFSRDAIAAEAARFAPQLVLEKYRAVYAQLMAA